MERIGANSSLASNSKMSTRSEDGRDVSETASVLSASVSLLTLINTESAVNASVIEGSLQTPASLS